MNKLLIIVYVPLLGKNYDVFIPINKKTIEIIFLLNKAINEMSGGAFKMADTLSLINADDGTIYDTDRTFLENGILNGAKLILL